MCSPATGTMSSMPRAVCGRCWTSGTVAVGRGCCVVTSPGASSRWPVAAGGYPRVGCLAGDGTGLATQPGLFVPLADDEECQSGPATGDGPVRLVGCRPGLARPGDPSAAGRVEPAAAGDSRAEAKG